MDLRSGHPFWLIKNGIIDTYPPLTSDEKCDVAIIGAGITGALVAACLIDEGVDVVVVDKRDVATGSTAASTALLQYEIDTELHELIDRVGEQHAVRSYRLGLEAIDWIEKRLKLLGEDCSLVRRKSLYLASRERDVERLKREYDCRYQHGFHVEYLDKTAIGESYPFTAPGAILNEGGGEIDAFRFTHMLLRDARSHGVRVYDRTEVTEIQNSPNGFALSTNRGPTIRGKRIVFATGYESENYLKKRYGALHSTFAIVSEPMEPFPDWPDRCHVWETSRPYFYLRTTTDNRVIIGGEDVPFATAHRLDKLLDRKQKRLISRFEKLVPGYQFETAYAWAGTFGDTSDGLPFIGCPPDRPNTYFALGYGGNGITMSVVAAGLIADDFVGRANPDAEIFRFDRIR